MDFKRIFDLLDDSVNMPAMHEGILDFVSPDSPHRKIGLAYDKASVKYDDYITGGNFLLKQLKKIALGLDREVIDHCVKIINEMIKEVERGVVLDIPAGTGLFSFEEYVKCPNILFIAADYSWGMLKKAKERVQCLNAQNIILVRADVGKLPFKAETFDAVLCLNGIHSFPEKDKAILQMSRVLKKGKKIHGSLVLRGERWLTDLILELAYYRLLLFTRPALTRKEFIDVLEKNNLKVKDLKFLKALAAFEAKKTAA